ncbi:type II toxin-antitoxin system VapC family toxin [Paracoccus spongiarum]|uniref:Type II toxin-antitoxin system VapC family toxin n=1 Tax=Paracoccus spongiarum TaxID=3064387 RepID=A0ABT9J6Z9_9RHOB|nr:type II toxin-antitoxin system VapC family toxin [Paracoccus sp. 2205BS29-5]MDP5305575.1 type II toxin-antitoxin system VapC family toxin [Paracoccus sp. 2205BS29-5]
MLAIDTNVVVRYLTNDHPKQSPRARALVDGQPVFVAVTVILETEWVLRSTYDYRPADIARVLCAFAGLPTVTVEDGMVMVNALDHAERGMDSADALHLGKAAHCEGMASFDRKFVKAAKIAGYGRAGLCLRSVRSARAKILWRALAASSLLTSRNRLVIMFSICSP